MTTILSKASFPMADIQTHQVFEPGATTEAQEDTPWLKVQIEGGVFVETLSAKAQAKAAARAEMEAEAKENAKAEAAARAEAEEKAKAEAAANKAPK